MCSKLCTEDMTCFEPEACAQLVTGMEFHKFYFDHCKFHPLTHPHPSHTHTLSTPTPHTPSIPTPPYTHCPSPLPHTSPIPNPPHTHCPPTHPHHTHSACVPLCHTTVHDHTQGSDVGRLRRLLCVHPPHPNSQQVSTCNHASLSYSPCFQR